MTALHAIRNTGAGMVCFIVHVVEQKQRAADGRRRWVQVAQATTHADAERHRSRLALEALPLRVRPVLAQLGC